MPANTFYTQKTYDFQNPIAVAGMLQGVVGEPQTRNYRNDAVSRPQAFTLTPAAGGYTGAAASSYAVNVTLPDATVVSYTVAYPSAPFPHTELQLSAAIIAGWNRNVTLFSLATAAADGNNVRITGRGLGQAGLNQPTYSDWATSVAVVNTGGIAVASTTIPRLNATPIPYARVVSYETGDPAGTARLAVTTASVSVGLTYLDRLSEQRGRFEDAKMEIPIRAGFDVIKKTLAMDGMWMPVMETVDNRVNTTVYSICGGANAGKLSTTPGADRKTEPRLTFVSNSAVDSNGETIVLVEANYPQGN